jgi:RNA polymerase sigma-70 factor (ECF subfamily)
MIEIEMRGTMDPAAVKLRSRARPRDRSSSSRVSTTRTKAAADEAQLIERLKNGDEQALEVFFDLYSANLYNVAQRILGEAADSEEVVQDVFWTAYRKASLFKGNSRFSTWLYRLTVNAALGRIRGSKKRREIAYEEILPKFQNDGHHKFRPIIDWTDTLELRVSRNEIKEMVGAALNNLKLVDRAVVVLSDLDGFSDKEIAGTLNLTVSAVKTRLHRARLFLRGTLAAKLGPCPFGQVKTSGAPIAETFKAARASNQRL